MDIKRYLSIFSKGLAMGMADVVPGVSGGTIAFITGIYEELIHSIGLIDLKAFQIFRKEGLAAAFKYVNGPFLVSLGLGVAVSILSLARAITYLLDTYPVVVWSFFFGLILASAIYIASQIAWKQITSYISLVVGALIALAIGMASPSGGDVGLLYVFFSGAIAICAMILPGISGSFILLLLGSYATIFGAIGHLTDEPSSQLPIVATFALGAILGLLSFAKLLKYLFSSHNTLTMATLTGFMIGSLWKVWPWKQTLSTRINSKGEEVPLEQLNISPDTYSSLLTVDSELWQAILFAVLGIAIVFLLSRVDRIKSN